MAEIKKLSTALDERMPRVIMLKTLEEKDEIRLMWRGEIFATKVNKELLQEPNTPEATQRLISIVDALLDGACRALVK